MIFLYNLGLEDGARPQKIGNKLFGLKKIDANLIIKKIENFPFSI